MSGMLILVVSYQGSILLHKSVFMRDYCIEITEDNHNQLFREGIHSTVVARWTAGQQVERLICTRGMIHNKFPLISPGCPWPRIALTVQKRGLKHHLFICLEY